MIANEREREREEATSSEFVQVNKLWIGLLSSQ